MAVNVGKSSGIPDLHCFQCGKTYPSKENFSNVEWKKGCAKLCKKCKEVDVKKEKAAAMRAASRRRVFKENFHEIDSYSVDTPTEKLYLYEFL
jgi:hypothetical protein